MNEVPSFADLLRSHRIAIGLTQQELADRAQLGWDTIGALERGIRKKPHRFTVTQLADALALVDPERAVFFAVARGTPIVAQSPQVRLAHPERDAVDERSAISLPLSPADWPPGNYWGALPDRPLVSRTAECAVFAEILRTTEQGHGACLVVGGEPGIGKTRLGQELLRVAGQSGFLILVGRCYPHQRDVPYTPFLELLVTLSRSAPASFRAQMLQRWPIVRVLLPGYSASDPHASNSVPVDQQLILWAVTHMLQALATVMPLVIAVDDIHWADAASLTLWEHLARYTHNTRVLVMGAYRNTETAPEHPLVSILQRLEHEHLAKCMTLRALPFEEVSTFVATTLGQHGSAELCHELQRITAGNPLFLFETLMAWYEQGNLTDAEGVWRQRWHDPLVIASTVRAMIQTRLALLPRATKELLNLASVLGHHFLFDDVCRIACCDEQDAEDALQAAVLAGFVFELEPNHFLFRHILVRDALYAALSPRQQRRWHRAAGESLATAVGHAARAAEIAAHFLSAAAPSQALPYLILAGDQAERLFAHADAIHTYSQALDIAVALAEEAPIAVIREKLGGALDLQGQSDAALSHLEAAAAAFAARGAIKDHLRVVARIGRAHGTRGTVTEGIMRLHQTLASTDIVATESNTSLTQGVAQVETELARLYAWSGRSAEALPHAIQAQFHANLAGDAHLKALAAMIHGAALSNLDRLVESATAIEAAIPLLEAAGDLRNLCDALTNLNWAYNFLGQMDQCRRCIEQGLAVAERLGDPSIIASMIFWRGNNALASYDWISARQDFEDAYNKRMLIDARTYLTESIYLLGFIALYQGRWSEAEPLYARAIALAKEEGQMADLQFLYNDLAVRELAEGRPQEARALEDTLRGLIGSSDFLPLWGPMRAWIALELGEGEAAANMITLALERTKLSGNRMTLQESLRVMGLVHLRRQQFAAAHGCLTQALAVARSFPFPLGEIQILYTLGHCYLDAGDPDKARQRWQEGLEVGVHIDEGLWRPHLQAALDALPAS